MKPLILFQEPLIQAYHCDCMDFMADKPDNYYDLAIVDPPYQIADNPSRHGGSGKLKNRILNQSAKKFKKWDIAPDMFYFHELYRISQNQIIWGGNYFDLPPTRGVICWDKCQPWENFSQWEMAWTSFNYPAKLFKFDNRTGDKIHPTQKPVALYRWLFKNYAKPCDKIFDSHGGSFSSVIACALDGYEMDICEIDQEYFDAAIKRFKEQTCQIQLF